MSTLASFSVIAESVNVTSNLSFCNFIFLFLKNLLQNRRILALVRCVQRRKQQQRLRMENAIHVRQRDGACKKWVDKLRKI